MNPTALLVLVIVVGVVVVAAVVLYLQKQHLQKRRSEGLHEQFGPEYERTVRQRGDHRRAESELEARQERVALTIRIGPSLGRTGGVACVLHAEVGRRRRDVVTKIGAAWCIRGYRHQQQLNINDLG